MIQNLFELLLGISSAYSEKIHSGKCCDHKRCKRLPKKTKNIFQSIWNRHISGYSAYKNQNKRNQNYSKNKSERRKFFSVIFYFLYIYRQFCKYFCSYKSSPDNSGYYHGCYCRRDSHHHHSSKIYIQRICNKNGAC